MSERYCPDCGEVYEPGIDNEHGLNNAMGALPMPTDGIALFVPVDAYSESASLLAENRRNNMEYESD